MADTLNGAGGLQSIPALLQRNASEFGSKAAYREKEYGIWQSWSWAETEKEIEAGGPVGVEPAVDKSLMIKI